MRDNKDVNYFDMFIDSANYVSKAAYALLDMVNNFTDVEKKVEQVHFIEHEADMLYHKLYQRLMRSFMTPIDREDILQLAQKLDDVTDLIEDIAYCFVMFEITVLRPDTSEFLGLIVKTCDLTRDAVVEFKQFTKSKTLSDKIRDINHSEEEGDRFYKNAVRQLFRQATDPLDAMKWREIYYKMENVLDACEDVADTIEGVIIKNS